MSKGINQESKGVDQLPPPIKTFVTMSAKSADKNKKASKQQTHRWNLQGVPNILRKATLDYLFVHRDYVYKKMAKKKLSHRLVHGFEAHCSSFRDCSQSIKVVIGESEQKKIWDKQYETKIRYADKDINEAEAKMKILCNTMSEKIDKHFVQISEFMNLMNNVDRNVPMDDDANDPWDHVQDQNKEAVFMIIASAKVATDEIADNEYERWEQSFTTKLAIKATKVKNDAIREEIEKVRKYDNPVDDQNQLDVHVLNKQVEMLSKAMAILVTDKKNNNSTRTKNEGEHVLFPPQKKVQEATQTREREDHKLRDNPKAREGTRRPARKDGGQRNKNRDQAEGEEKAMAETKTVKPTLMS